MIATLTSTDDTQNPLLYDKCNKDTNIETNSAYFNFFTFFIY